MPLRFCPHAWVWVSVWETAYILCQLTNQPTIWWTNHSAGTQLMFTNHLLTKRTNRNTLEVELPMFSHRGKIIMKTIWGRWWLCSRCSRTKRVRHLRLIVCARTSLYVHSDLQTWLIWWKNMGAIAENSRQGDLRKSHGINSANFLLA